MEKWRSKNGIAEVVRVEGERAFVKYENLPGLRVERVSDLPRLKLLDESWAAAAEVPEVEVVARDTPLERYLATLTPMQAGKARKSLEIFMNFRGVGVMRRHERIEQAIKAGGVVRDDRLYTGENVFYTLEVLTLTGMRYARWLTEQE